MKLKSINVAEINCISARTRTEPETLRFENINIFIGKNNSGKSYFLRKLAEATLTKDEDKVKVLSPKISSWIESCKYAFLRHVDDYYSSEDDDTEHESTKEKINLYFRSFLSDYEMNGVSKSSEIEYSKLLPVQESDDPWSTNGKEQFSDINNELKKEYNKILDSLRTDYSIHYLPMMRGLKSLIRPSEQIVNYSLEKRRYELSERLYRSPRHGDRKDIYLARVEEDYFSDENMEKYGWLNGREDFVFTSIDMHHILIKKLLGNHESRSAIREYEKFLGTHLFDGQKIELSPEWSDDESKLSTINICIGDDKDIPLSQLGDGMQSLISCTFLPFVKQQGIYFIEEPETMIHPGMQFKLISSLANLEDCQFFISTHSNHLIDISIDYHANLYFCSRDGDFSKGIHTISRLKWGDTNILKSLGIKASSVFLVNATIWVEGITERYYLQRYLELYQKHELSKGVSFKTYRKDVHFSFVEYAGSNITHLNVLDEEKGINVDRICAQMLLIADNDGCNMSRVEGDTEPEDDWTSKEERLWKLRQKLKDRFLALEVREIENLLTPHVINYVVHCWKKVNRATLVEGTEPETVFSAEQDDYRNEYLGTYIQGAIDDSYGTFCSKSGTVARKVDFAQLALERIRSWDDMSPDAQDLAKRIYEFIKQQNES